MSEPVYQYPEGELRSPLRALVALWRSTLDPSNYHEVKLVEMGFARSRLGLWFSRWEDVAEAMHRDPRTADRMRRRPDLAPIDLEALERLPPGTLGSEFARHCRRNRLNPNLMRLRPRNDAEWLLNDFYRTHDIWHVVTGFENDLCGEAAILAFYVAQLHSPRFIALLLSMFLVKSVFRAPARFGERMAAVARGYGMGRQAAPLFGVEWDRYWPVPLAELRRELRVETELGARGNGG